LFRPCKLSPGEFCSSRNPIWSGVLGEVRLLKNSPHYKTKLRD